jgi:hypothetical protein
MALHPSIAPATSLQRSLLVSAALTCASLFAIPCAYAQAAPQLSTYQASGCEGRAKLPTFERWLGRKVDRVLDGISPQSWDQMKSTAGWIAGCWQGQNVQVTVTVPMIPWDGKSSIAQGVKGSYDHHFYQIGQALVAKGLNNAVIRIGPEHNASWFVWSSLKNPEDWATYWRRIVIMMRTVPGQNFKFDWTVALGPGVKSPEPAYPGDAYVDIIGADVYNANFYPTTINQAQLWNILRDSPFGLKWHAAFAAKHGKMMSYPEWATGYRPAGFGGGDDAIFMRNMSAWIKSNNVLYHSYWDYAAPDYNGKISDGSQPKAGAEYLNAFGGPR